MGYIPRGSEPLKGDKGDRGRPGTPGQSVAGRRGRQGERGSLWFSGSGPPTVLPDQQNGDLYLDYDSDNDDYYQLIAGSWVLLGQLAGTGIPEVFVQAAAPVQGLTPWAWFQLDVDGPTGNVEFVKVYQP